MSIERYRKLLPKAEAGEEVGILIRGLTKKEVKRGDVLASPGLVRPHKEFDASVYFFTPSEGGRGTIVNNYYEMYMKVNGRDYACQIIHPGDVEYASSGDTLDNIHNSWSPFLFLKDNILY